MDDFFKKLSDHLSVCLKYAVEDIEDFLWVMDQDEKDGLAPENLDQLREIYHQLQEQYTHDGDDLQKGLGATECLDIAVNLVEVYQAMFDYLMSGDDAGYTGEPVSEAETSKPRLGPRDADFSAMLELFRKNKDLPS